MRAIGSVQVLVDKKNAFESLNFFDRLIYKAVPDFIDFHIGNFHWFIFNVSDIFITLGVIGMIIMEFIGNNKKNEIFSKYCGKCTITT